MRTVETRVYSARELSPDALERAAEHYVTHLDCIPWQDETMDSLKACVSHAGFRIRDYSIGAHSHCSLELAGDDSILDLRGPRALAWFENHYLSLLRIPWAGPGRDTVRRYGYWYRPGMVRPCPFTGYCFDDDCIEHVGKRLKDGDTVREAFESLAPVVGKQWEGELDYLRSPEGFLDMAEANEWEFSEDGKRWRGGSK